MRIASIFKTAFLCTLFACAFSTGVQAQVPSLAPSDTYFMTVKTEFGNETFTIIRDGRIEEQFYFVPARPHVAVETKNGKTYPVFQLLSYQRKQDDNTLKQGGVLQLSVQMGISKKTESALLDEIKGQFPLSDAKKQHRLSPIPMKEASITMYSLDGNMMDSAPIKEGVAPIFGNQQYPFMLNLTDLGSDVMEALCRGRGGLPVIVTYTFQGMTEPGGFKVEVNWDACYKHFSTDTKLRAKVAYKSLGADLGGDFSTIREEMIANGMMKVTSLTNEALSEESLDAAMNPVINLITTELFESIKAPPQIPPAAAKELAPASGAKEAETGTVAVAPKSETAAATPKTASGTASTETTPAATATKAASDSAAAAAGGIASATGAALGNAIGGAANAATTALAATNPLTAALDVIMNSKIDLGASFALKDAKFVKKGKFVYTYDRQAVVERKTSFGGPIGIGSFDKKIQDQCIVVLPNGNWEAAFYMLPPVGDPARLGFKQMNLSVVPFYKDAPVSGMKIETAIFNRNNDPVWVDKNGKEVSLFLFPLKAVYDSPQYKSDPTSFKFRTNIEVIPAIGPKITTISDAPLFDGDKAMAPPSDLLEPVFISADCLSFGAGDDEVYLVKGTLKADKFSFSIKLDANSTSQGFLIPKDTKSVKISGLQFISKKGKKIAWPNNEKNLQSLFPDFDVMLFDEDWKESPAEGALISQPEAASAK